MLTTPRHSLEAAGGQAELGVLFRDAIRDLLDRAADVLDLRVEGEQGVCRGASTVRFHVEVDELIDLRAQRWRRGKLGADAKRAR